MLARWQLLQCAPSSSQGSSRVWSKSQMSGEDANEVRFGQFR
jgi:hypothetical protein